MTEYIGPASDIEAKRLKLSKEGFVQATAKRSPNAELLVYVFRICDIASFEITN